MTRNGIEKRAAATLLMLLLAASLPDASPAAMVRVVGVQLAISPSVYRSSMTYAARLDEAVGAAVAQSGRKPGEELVVILPEHVGTFLSFQDEASAIYGAPTRPLVAAFQVLTSPRFMLYHLKSCFLPGGPRFLSTYGTFSNILRYKARVMWTTYVDVASALARKYRITLVPGSTCVPRPEDLDKPLAPIYGTAAVFGPEGELLGIVRKVHPVLEENMFLTAAPAAELKPIRTRAGRIGVLICSDSWYEDTYRSLKDAQLLAIPSIGEGGHEVFDKGLRGFRDHQLYLAGSGDKSVPSVLEQLMKNGAPGRISLTRAVAAVQPLLSGAMWDLKTGGPGLAVKRSAGKVLVEMIPSADNRDTFLNFAWKK